ncbi:MAG TPA: lysophospholipid acyltransferase family protein [Candidatus Polarisedimenticolaceae bacterium]|nr:lysophospholipid acyltransferase family protein [Candidatus Polarisedimenticolaceae bacterium]
MNRARQLVEAAAVETAFRLARVLPRRALLGLGAAAGALLGRIDLRHTRIARENLARAYGDTVPAPERERILRRCWRHFGRIGLDVLYFPRLGRDDLGGVLAIEGAEHLRQALTLGRGALVFSAHYGHWEAGAYAMGLLEIPFAVIGRPLDNPLLERRLLALRGGTGNAVIPKRRAVRETMKALAAGTAVAILIDQDARDDGVFVPFFGRPASTTPTLALLALRTGAPVVPVFARVAADGTIGVHVQPAVPIEATGDRDADVLRVTAACTAVVETWVRRDPEQWLWMHRRWKTVPRGGSE